MFLSTFQINSAIANRRLLGLLEEVKFDGVAMGLWNFVDGAHNFDGCRERFVNNLIILDLSVI